MLVCSVAGMHRSGTSMITRLLNLAGMELGSDLYEAAEDNPEGFWEHREFSQLNDNLLDFLGGAWDWPPDLPPNWAEDPKLEPFYNRAHEIINQFGNVEWWGWKDPRNSLLLPFWQKLLPDLKVIYCLRHPFEVSRSLQKRGGYHSLNYGYQLWYKYNTSLLNTVRPGNCIITHYESYFVDPQAELQRLLDFLGVTVSSERLAQACNAVFTELRHNRIQPGQISLPPSVQHQYESLCRQAGPIYQKLAGINPQIQASGDTHVSEDLPRLIAFYLPQYHPIAENDEWWGKGFTEWTNVTKAEPLFPGHYQPHLPADFGFYDLRLPEVRQAQADLARQYGIYGFCYHHYWFQGRRLLEQPFQKVLDSGQPDFPFCLSWANESWTRRWDGLNHDYLMLQEYSHEDDLAHIRWLLKVFEDPRYIKIDNKPLFLVYNLKALPNPARTAELWREEARCYGFPDLYLCKAESFADYTDPATDGFDAVVEFPPHAIDLMLPKLTAPYPAFQTNSIFDYAQYVQAKLNQPEPIFRKFNGVAPSWDNTARHRNGNAFILHGSTPSLYQQWLRTLVEREVASKRPLQEKLIFINAWNEWAEGAHLEPDLRYGHAYLEATRRALHGESLLEKSYPPPPEMVQQWQFREASIPLHESTESGTDLQYQLDALEKTPESSREALRLSSSSSEIANYLSNPFSTKEFFLDTDSLINLGRAYAEQYSESKPFPHLVLDNFLPTDVMDVLSNNINALPEDAWNHRDSIYQKKLHIPDVEKLPAPIRRILHQFNTAPMLKFLEELTGIKGLVPDPYYLGGGLHRILPGGKLEVHADFNLHPHLKLERRLNVLIYLNKDWQDVYNGHLELWNANMEKCEVKIAPVFNRCIIFTLGERTFHGHPAPLACPTDVSRKSIALYYYTKPRTEPDLQYRDTAWQERPEQPYLGAEFYRLENEAQVMTAQYLEEQKRRMALEVTTSAELTALREQLNQVQQVYLTEKATLERELKEVQHWALDMQHRLQQADNHRLSRLVNRLRKGK